MTEGQYELRKNRRRALEQFATANSYDPHSSSDWYHLYKSRLQETKVDEMWRRTKKKGRNKERKNEKEVNNRKRERERE